MLFPELGEHEQGIWRFIAAYIQTHSRAPTFSEIGRGVRIASKDHVSRDLKRLHAAGCIELTRGISRGIRLVRNPDGSRVGTDTISLPLLGVIHAGAAIPTLEQISTPIDWLDVSRNLVGAAQNAYVLQVMGDSMIDALVNDGDLIVLEPTPTAKNGEMVAVWLKHKHATTLKRFYRRNGWAILKPENPTLPEKKYKPSDIVIQGKVVCIIRNLKDGRAILPV